MNQKSVVTSLKEYVKKSNWNRTPAQKLASERNWCRFMLAGMEALTGYMEKRKWLSASVSTQLRRAITSARWSVEASWDSKYNEMVAKERKSK
jgi:hypothetical protein